MVLTRGKIRHGAFISSKAHFVSLFFFLSTSFWKYFFSVDCMFLPCCQFSIFCIWVHSVSIPANILFLAIEVCLISYVRNRHINGWIRIDSSVILSTPSLLPHFHEKLPLFGSNDDMVSAHWDYLPFDNEIIAWESTIKVCQPQTIVGSRWLGKDFAEHWIDATRYALQTRAFCWAIASARPSYRNEFL